MIKKVDMGKSEHENTRQRIKLSIADEKASLASAQPVSEKPEKPLSLFVRLKMRYLSVTALKSTNSSTNAPQDEDYERIARSLSHEDFPVKLGDEEEHALPEEESRSAEHNVSHKAKR